MIDGIAGVAICKGIEAKLVRKSSSSRSSNDNDRNSNSIGGGSSNLLNVALWPSE